MNDNKDLDRKEGVKKIRKIIGNDPIGMMATNLLKIPFSVCPMTTQEVDSNGNLWFFSAKNSDHHKDIQEDNRIQILYANHEKQEYLSLYGTAVFILDDKKLDELWNPKLNLWFSGKKDPNLALTYVSTDQAYYWDNKASKQVGLFKIAKVAVTGEKLDVGIKGKVNLGDQ